MAQISIIIPVYNAEQYLNECLQSVASQSFTDFEVMLVDDGSKDHSGVICDDFSNRDSRFRVIHQENGGVSAARNTGLKSAKGDYITFIDSDDTVLPNHLSDMMDVIGDKSQIVFSDLNGKEENKIVDVELTPQVIADHPHILNGSPVNKLFLKSIISENGLRFPVDISTMEDNIFVWNYIAKCKIASISAANNYIYNQHEDSLVRSVHRIEEIHELCQQIMPAYSQLIEKIMPETISKCDNYLFVSCLKRLMISNCSGVSLTKCKKIVSESVDVMRPIIMRMSERSDLTKKDSFLLKIMKFRWIWLLSSYSMLNSMKYSEK